MKICNFFSFNNEEIIKPLLRGKDIQKWKINYKNFYLIFTRRGININKYPIIKDYLSIYKEDLTPKSKNSNKTSKGRKPGPYKWYEIQDNVAYFSSFEKKKIIYSIISSEPQFVLDENGYYMLDSCFILNSKTLNLNYLLALLNSKLLFWYFKDICYSLNKRGFQYKKIFMEQMPIKFSKNHEFEINKLVESILTLNKIIPLEIKKFHVYLKECLQVTKLPKNLNEFYKLSDDDFFNELEKINNLDDNLIINEIFKKFILFKSKIDSMDQKNKYLNQSIDTLIYKIYDLNPDEIKIIEEELNNL